MAFGYELKIKDQMTPENTACLALQWRMLKSELQVNTVDLKTSCRLAFLPWQSHKKQESLNQEAEYHVQRTSEVP